VGKSPLNTRIKHVTGVVGDCGWRKNSKGFFETTLTLRRDSGQTTQVAAPGRVNVESGRLVSYLWDAPQGGDTLPLLLVDHETGQPLVLFSSLPKWFVLVPGYLVLFPAGFALGYAASNILDIAGGWDALICILGGVALCWAGRRTFLGSFFRHKDRLKQEALAYARANIPGVTPAE
jgi:hypothetical protein